jgi:hypothetical protein
MADRSFEMRVDRLFAENPAFPDGDLFARRVEARIERGWTFRRTLIGALGIAGGLIGGAQVLGSGVLQRVGALTSQSSDLVSGKVAELAGSHVLPGGLEVNGEILLMSAAMAVLAIGFGVTRILRDL